MKPKKKQAGAATSNSTSTDTPVVGSAGELPEPEIIAYSQQSRFHRETFDASDTDIDLKGVHVSVNNKDLLVDAHLRLKAGVRYGMVGQNGRREIRQVAMPHS